MNVEELSMIGPSVDLRTVDSIHKKRLLAFVNHFVISTTSFLNTVSKSCEERFMTLEDKIQRLEASIVILESKLSSVPGLGDEQQRQPEIEPEPAVPKERVAGEEAPQSEEMSETAAEDQTESELSPELVKYVKMLQFGVPPPAVKIKMTQEGIDPSLHELVLKHVK